MKLDWTNFASVEDSPLPKDAKVVQLEKTDGSLSNVGVFVDERYPEYVGSVLIRKDGSPPNADRAALAEVVGQEEAARILGLPA